MAKPPPPIPHADFLLVLRHRGPTKPPAVPRGVLLEYFGGLCVALLETLPHFKPKHVIFPYTLSFKPDPFPISFALTFEKAQGMKNMH